MQSTAKKSQRPSGLAQGDWNRLPTKVTEQEFAEHIRPHISLPQRGWSEHRVPLWRIFNYILYQLHTGCPWAVIPIPQHPGDRETGDQLHLGLALV